MEIWMLLFIASLKIALSPPTLARFWRQSSSRGIWMHPQTRYTNSSFSQVILGEHPPPQRGWAGGYWAQGRNHHLPSGSQWEHPTPQPPPISPRPPRKDASGTHWLSPFVQTAPLSTTTGPWLPQVLLCARKGLWPAGQKNRRGKNDDKRPSTSQIHGPCKLHRASDHSVSSWISHHSYIRLLHLFWPSLLANPNIVFGTQATRRAKQESSKPLLGEELTQ